MAEYRKDNTGTVWRAAYNPDGSLADWFETDLDELPRAIPPSGKQQNPIARSAVGKQEQRDLERTQRLAQRGKMAQMRAEEAKNMPFLDRFMIMAGYETDQLMRGVEDIGDMLDYTLLAGQPGLGKERKKWIQDNALRRTNMRGVENERNKEWFKEMQENAGAGHLGGMLPYIPSSIIAGPTAAKLAGGMIDTTKTVAKETGKLAGKEVKEGVEYLAKKKGPIGEVAQIAKEEISDPIARYAMRKGKQTSLKDPLLGDWMSRTLGDIGLGGLEGGLHYSMTPMEGMIGSGAGSVAGTMMRPRVRRAPNFYKEAGDQPKVDLIEWGKDQGMEFLPGMETGSNRMQLFESALRADADWTDTIRRIDRNNDAKLREKAYEAMGVPPGQKDVMTPAQLKDYRQNLRNEYTALEAGTKGKFEYKTLADLSAHVARLNSSKSPLLRQAGKEGEAILKEFRDMFQPVRGADGRMQAQIFDGSKYREMHHKIKSIADSTFDTNRSTYNTMMMLDGALKEGMERGIRDYQGEVSAGMWKDLNERYAMTNLVLKHGMDPTGNVDPNRLMTHLMSKDTTRLMLEEGGRIVDLQKMSKLNFMQKNASKSTLAGHNMKGIENPGRVPLWHRFLKGPMGGYVPILPRMYMKAYSKGIPSKTGYLNMGPGGVPGDLLGKFWDEPGVYTRAYSMGTPWDPAELGMNAYEWGERQVDSAKDMGIDFKEWLLGNGN